MKVFKLLLVVGVLVFMAKQLQAYDFTITDPNGNLSYGYNGAGGGVSIIDPDGNITLGYHGSDGYMTLRKPDGKLIVGPIDGPLKDLGTGRLIVETRQGVWQEIDQQ